MNKKKTAIIALILVLVAAAVGGGIFAFQKQRDKKTSVDVYAVSMLDWGYSEDQSYSSGIVTDDKSQMVYLDTENVVEEVYVKAGDTVAKGDALLRYNMQEVNLNIEMKALEVSTAENDLVIAQRDLERLRATTPIPENVPQPEEEKEPEIEEKSGDAYNIIGKKAKAFEGNGSTKSPFRFLCTKEAYVKGEYLNYLKEHSYTAIFEVHKANKKKGAVLNAWLVNGASIEETYEAEEKWSVVSRAVVEEEEEPEEDEEFEEGADGYTAVELAKEIYDTEKKVRQLDIDRRKLQLELEQLRKASGDGVVRAEVDGVVSNVQDIENMADESEPVIEIRGQSSLYVTGSLSELLLEEIEVGQKVLVNSWESGQTYEGTITEISTTPTDNNDYMGMGNPNASYYPYKALVENCEGLRNGESVDLTIDQSAEEGSICIEKAYIRTENGKSYVMKRGKDKRLVKQYIKTGKSVYGQAVQILSGITQDDYIAFPYGKNVKEGVKTKISEDMGY